MISRRLFGLFVVLCLVVVLGLAGTLEAQENDPELWGAGTDIHFVSAEEFNCAEYTGDCRYRDYSDGFWGSSNPEYVLAPVELPAGALVQSFRVLYSDEHASLNLSLALNRYYFHLITGVGTETIESWVSSGAPGIDSEWVDIDPDITIAYRYETTFGPGYASYVLRVHLPDTTAVEFRGVLVYWNRQISPAPASATFADVPVGAFGFKHVEALAASGITAGCGGGNFCPNQPLTRVQMAVFLAKALGLHWAP